MAYLGGTGYFAGPVIGAVVLTWLQSSLSAYTAAWQLYVGIVFIVVILYAPGGLAGLVAMHLPIARTRALRKVLLSYAVAVIPVVIMAMGAASMIEMSYRLATQRELGTAMRFGPFGVDAVSPAPWVIGGLMALLGWLAFRATWRYVAAAWSAAVDEARGVQP